MAENKLKLLKERLQFTGWLQYIPLVFAALLIFVLALIPWFLKSFGVFYSLAGISGILILAFISDVLLIKYKLHLPEKLPRRREYADVFDLMRARRSCRSFQNRKLNDADRDALLEAARVQTDVHNGTLFEKVTIRLEYIAAPLVVWPTVGATEFLVAIAPREYNRHSVIDVGRSLQKVVIEATRLGIATCWIGPGADQTSVVQHLGDRFDAGRDHVICVCAIGYKSRHKPLFLRLILQIQRRRLPVSSLFFTDLYFSQPLDPEQEPFRQFGRSFEVCQWSPSSFNGQTTRCAAVLGGAPEQNQRRLVRFDFFETTDSRYYAPVALGIWCANWELACAGLGIQGHFRVLSEKDRGLNAGNQLPALPRYELSWVLDSPITFK